MIEKKVCFIADSGRGPGAEIAKDEPSHIHLPRRRRVVRHDDRGTENVRIQRGGTQER